MNPTPSHEASCLNCGTLLIGAHCHTCGQHMEVHRTLGAFFHDLLHGLLHLEGRLWRTMVMLALHPGRLTRNYIAGQRVRYVSPIALFLFCAFVMFAALHLSSEQHSGWRYSITMQQDEDRAKPPLHLGSELHAGGQSTISVDKVELPSWLDHGLEKFRHNPELAVAKLQFNAHKYTWALIPPSVALLWLLLAFNRRFGLYDHAVFITFSLAFMMLVRAVGGLLDAVNLPGSIPLMLLVPPPHLYRQLREAYALRWWAALWRTAVLLAGGAVLLVLFLGLLLSLNGLE